ncbi:p21-activated protein kinase-interacting protein 1-like [Dorcoceras hygrometricum]|uniref:p21-activated protein kinase-interacting protein 1-like n=1 Tax=Dorcoceras hygrometricum TaxID=472368 RepID=A0A2Z7CUV2_9LAMI|nr:p21-activated protein kinase-interacting protein 1-like [Dorcoceras hygrometricum]
MLSKSKLVWRRLELDDSKESELVSAWNSSGLIFIERSELDGWIAYNVVASYFGYTKLDIRSGCRSVFWRNQFRGVRYDSTVRIGLVRGFSVISANWMTCTSLDSELKSATVHQIMGDLYIEDVDDAHCILLQHLESISPRKLTLYCSETLTVHRNLFPSIPGGFRSEFFGTLVVVIVAQKLRFVMCHSGFPGYSAGREVSQLVMPPEVD